MRPRPPLGPLALLLLLAACGGGGGGGGNGGSGDDGPAQSGDGPAGDPSFAVGTVSTAALTAIGFEGDGSLRGIETAGTVALATGAVTDGPFAGTLSADRTRIDLAGGGSVTLTDPAATEYVRVFGAAPAGATPSFGVVGFLSPPGDLPGSGQVRYSGTSSVVATDATRLYTLGGTADIVADFGTREVTIGLTNLQGTAQGISPGNTGTVAVPGGGRIDIAGSRISGAAFSGGRATASGTPFALTAGANAAGTQGGFFGPGADETAGRVVIDDPAGDVSVLGTFAAD